MKKLISVITIINALAAFTSFGQATASRLDDYLQNLLNEHIIPGMSVVVVNQQEVLFSKGYGVESLQRNAPFTTQTVAGVGSLTKSLTALAILQLVQEGSVQLDEKIIYYLPWFRTANKELSDQITVRMLINNTSGLYSSNEILYENNPTSSLSQFTKRLRSTYLTRQPGMFYEYSNAAFNVAGLIIETVSGLSYSQYLKTKILLPLGMMHTSTDPADFSSLKVIGGHYYGIDQAIRAQREEDAETAEYAPSGLLLSSSSDDVGRYLIALLNGGKFGANSILNQENTALLFEKNISFPGLTKEEGGDNSEYGYGLGWMMSTIDKEQYFHHGGSTGKTSTFTIIDHRNKIAASILVNIDLSFANHFCYPSSFNIIYNIIRIMKGHSPSGFANPKTKDKTLNAFELPVDTDKSFLGMYTLKSGGDFILYFGVDLLIQKVNKVLTGKIVRGSQVITEFNLDFINKSLAISRNTAAPSNLKFILSIDGEVKEVFYKNMRFMKVTAHPKTDDLRTIAMDNGISFQIPLRFTVTGSDRTAHVLTDSVFQIECHFQDTAQYAGAGNLPLSKGIKSIRMSSGSSTFMHGSRRWNQSTATCLQNGTWFKVLILSTRIKQKSIHFVVIFPPNTNTTEVKILADIFLDTVSM